MSETIGAVDVWENANGGRDFSRVEIAKITYKNGDRAGSSYLRAYGVDGNGKRQIIKNAYRGDNEGLETAFNEYLRGWHEEPGGYLRYKDKVEAIGVYHGQGALGGDYDVLRVLGEHEHEGQKMLEVITRHREMSDDVWEIPVVNRTFVPADKVRLFGSETFDTPLTTSEDLSDDRDEELNFIRREYHKARNEINRLRDILVANDLAHLIEKTPESSVVTELEVQEENLIGHAVVETEDYKKVSGLRRLFYAPTVLAATALATRGVKVEGVEKDTAAEVRHRRFRKVWIGAGALAVAGATAGIAYWLGTRTGNSGIDAAGDQSPIFDSIGDNLSDQLGDLADLLEDAAEQLEEEEEEPTNTGVDESDRHIVPSEGPVEGPTNYGGENIQVINAESGQSSFAVSLPEGWSVDNVDGHQVMYNESGINILEVGQEVKIKGKPEVLESFMDSQGNISKQGRTALRDMGYDLSQGQYEFKKPNGKTGLHFMTIVRKG